MSIVAAVVAAMLNLDKCREHQCLSVSFSIIDYLSWDSKVYIGTGIAFAYLHVCAYIAVRCNILSKKSLRSWIVALFGQHIYRASSMLIPRGIFKIISRIIFRRTKQMIDRMISMMISRMTPSWWRCERNHLVSFHPGPDWIFGMLFRVISRKRSELIFSMISTDEFQHGFQVFWGDFQFDFRNDFQNDCQADEGERVVQFPPWTRLNSRFYCNPDFELFSVQYILSPFYTVWVQWSLIFACVKGPIVHLYRLSTMAFWNWFWQMCNT